MLFNKGGEWVEAECKRGGSTAELRQRRCSCSVAVKKRHVRCRYDETQTVLSVQQSQKTRRGEERKGKRERTRYSGKRQDPNTQLERLKGRIAARRRSSCRGSSALLDNKGRGARRPNREEEGVRDK